VIDGIEVTQDMLDGASLYVDDVRTVLGDSCPASIQVEEPITLEGLHPEAWGTPDLVAVRPKHIFVWDYKFGHGYVDVFENWQLIAYSFPFVDALSPDEEMQTTVVFTIVQPRCFCPEGPVRRWSVKASDLRAHYNTLRGWLAEASSPLPIATPTPAACVYCSARHACQPLRDAAEQTVDYAKTMTAHTLDAPQLGRELAYMQDAQALLSAYISGLEEEVEGSIKHGVPVPGYTLAPASSPLRWSVPEELVAQLGEAMWAPRKLITPSQARDRKLISPEVLEAFAEREPGRLKLTRIDNSLAKKVFK
jgi:hypothetical protein